MGQAEISARRFHILADPIRLRIILLLRDQEICVGELAKTLGLNQPKVSYHLKLMHSEGLLERRTQGTWSYYSLCTDVRDWVNQELDRLLYTKSVTEKASGG
ncbi:MAG: helix-turn-helix transcriptional regulator [Firmicutes bacterium]|nr:helix-turn-helix transcriptional regulator [Bacillota bacterium]